MKNFVISPSYDKKLSKVILSGILIFLNEGLHLQKNSQANRGFLKTHSVTWILLFLLTFPQVGFSKSACQEFFVNPKVSEQSEFQTLTQLVQAIASLSHQKVQLLIPQISQETLQRWAPHLFHLATNSTRATMIPLTYKETEWSITYREMRSQGRDLPHTDLVGNTYENLYDFLNKNPKALAYKERAQILEALIRSGLDVSFLSPQQIHWGVWFGVDSKNLFLQQFFFDLAVQSRAFNTVSYALERAELNKDLLVAFVKSPLMKEFLEHYANDRNLKTESQKDYLDSLVLKKRTLKKLLELTEQLQPTLARSVQEELEHPLLKEIDESLDIEELEILKVPPVSLDNSGSRFQNIKFPRTLDRILMVSGDPDSIYRGDNKTPLELAIKLGALESIKILLRHGATPKRSDVYLAINQGDQHVENLLKIALRKKEQQKKDLHTLEDPQVRKKVNDALKSLFQAIKNLDIPEVQHSLSQVPPEFIRLEGHQVFARFSYILFDMISSIPIDVQLFFQKNGFESPYTDSKGRLFQNAEHYSNWVFEENKKGHLEILYLFFEHGFYPRARLSTFFALSIESFIEVAKHHPKLKEQILAFARETDDLDTLSSHQWDE